MNEYNEAMEDYYKSLYPTEEQLLEIARLGKEAKVKPLVEYLEDVWYYGTNRMEFIEKEDGSWSLYLSTAGWSGNESIIRVLEESIFWFMFWQKSIRGGHFWFEGKK